MNILIISSDYFNVGMSKHQRNITEKDYADNILLSGDEEVRIVTMHYRAGPRSNIECRRWDIIIMTEQAAKEIGDKEFAAKWYPPCAFMSSVFMVTRGESVGPLVKSLSKLNQG